MKVTDVTVWVVDVPQVAPIAPYRSHVRTSSTTGSAIVRVDTDVGISGWGECNVNFLPDISARQMQQQAEWLVGHDPISIVHFHQTCPLESRLKSALELALWDIFGKVANMPVYQMLGGLSRERIRTYNTCAGYRYVREKPDWKADDWGLDGEAEGPYEDLDAFLNRPGELARGGRGLGGGRQGRAGPHDRRPGA